VPTDAVELVPPAEATTGIPASLMTGKLAHGLAMLLIPNENMRGRQLSVQNRLYGRYGGASFVPANIARTESIFGNRQHMDSAITSESLPFCSLNVVSTLNVRSANTTLTIECS
jgi:hypothetical protein